MPAIEVCRNLGNQLHGVAVRVDSWTQEEIGTCNKRRACIEYLPIPSGGYMALSECPGLSELFHKKLWLRVPKCLELTPGKEQ